jgi:hypothetical protein
MKKSAAKKAMVVLTIGHSTRLLAEFLHLLQVHGVTRLVDVRTVPRSRHNPQFNKDTLPADLRRAGIAYQHMPGLGGLRHARPTPRTRRGGMRHSADTRTTCRRRSSEETWGC